MKSINWQEKLMQFLFVLFLLTILLAHFLFRVKAGVKDLKLYIFASTWTVPGKVFFIAAITSMIALVFMLLSGAISFSDLIELDMKMIEFCPLCIAA